MSISQTLQLDTVWLMTTVQRISCIPGDIVNANISRQLKSIKVSTKNVKINVRTLSRHLATHFIVHNFTLFRLLPVNAKIFSVYWPQKQYSHYFVFCGHSKRKKATQPSLQLCSRVLNSTLIHFLLQQRWIIGWPDLYTTMWFNRVGYPSKGKMQGSL